MSQLRHLLNSRTTDHKTNACYTTLSNSVALTVENRPNQFWVLPWVHLVRTRYEDSPQGESILLTFTTVEIILTGKSLKPLLEEIATLHLDSVRASPKEYSVSSDSTPFIEDISVQIVGAQPELVGGK